MAQEVHCAMAAMATWTPYYGALTLQHVNEATTGTHASPLTPLDLVLAAISGPQNTSHVKPLGF